MGALRLERPTRHSAPFRQPAPRPLPSRHPESAQSRSAPPAAEHEQAPLRADARRHRWSVHGAPLSADRPCRSLGPRISPHLHHQHPPEQPSCWLCFLGRAMHCRRWSCGARLAAWTWLWSLASLGARCIPANEGKARTGGGSMTAALGSGPAGCCPRFRVSKTFRLIFYLLIFLLYLNSRLWCRSAESRSARCGNRRRRCASRADLRMK